MIKKDFLFKLEEVPTVGDFVRGSLNRDLPDFTAFSPVFNSEFVTSIEDKTALCRDAVKTVVVYKELKSTTAKIKQICANLRPVINKVESYLNITESELDIAVKDFGLGNVRNTIRTGNIEGLTSNIQTLLQLLKRNSVALKAKGLTEAMIAGIEDTVKEVNSLNSKQNELISRRSLLSDENMRIFNDLWKDLQMVLKTGQSLYKGTDPTKAKEYTVTSLQKRVNAQRQRATVESADATVES